MIFIILAFCCFLAIFYFRQTQKFFSPYMHGIVIAWILSVVSLILYLGQHSFYYTIVNRVFGISANVWNVVMRMRIHLDMSVYFLNTSVMIFIFCLYALSVSLLFLDSGKLKTGFIISVFVFLLIQFFYYCPYIFKVVYWEVYESVRGSIGYEGLQNVLSILEECFRIADIGIVVLSICNFIIYYLRYPHILLLKRNLLLYLVSLFIIVVLFELLFSWLPIRVVKPTIIQDFYTYITPPLEDYLPLFRFLPEISFGFMALLLFMLARFKRKEHSEILEHRMASKNLNMAGLVTRMMAHSIKNYVLAIRSETEFLLEDMGSESEESERLKKIIEYCNMTFDSMDHASEKLHQINLKMKRVSANEFLSLSCEQLSVPKDHIELMLHSQLKDDAMIYVDGFYMKEVIKNIVDNAVEAIMTSHDNGKIEIEAKRVSQWVVLSITNDGGRIPEMEYEKIFQPFYSTKTKDSSWGIGLTYCRSIISGHFGRMTVESRSSDTTTFNVYLPILQK